MKSENYYWKKISKTLGIESKGMKTINYYLKKIYENLGGESGKRKSNNQYLAYISENLDGGGGTCDITVDWSLDGVIYQRIKSVTVPDSVTVLPNGFASINGLETINLPSTLTTIGNSCFTYAVDLKEITIPESVISIGYMAFPTGNSSKLEKVNLNWEENPVTYEESKMQLPNNSKAVFSIPKGTTALYESANYPSGKLVERE